MGKENLTSLPAPDYSFAKNIIKASGIVIPLAAGATILVDAAASLQDFGDNLEVYTSITDHGPDIYFLDQTRNQMVNVTKRDTSLDLDEPAIFYPVFIYAWEENGVYHVSRFSWIDFWQAALPIQELLESDTFFTPVVSEDGNEINFYRRGSENYFSLNVLTGNWVEVTLGG